MFVYFFFLATAFLTHFTECQKKPSVNFLILDETLSAIPSIKYTRQNWYTRCIKIQEAYVKKTICSQLHTWPEQLYAWYSSDITQMIITAEEQVALFIDNENIKMLQQVVYECGLSHQIIISDETFYNNVIANNYQCSIGAQYIQLHSSFLTLPITQQLFILCTLISSYTENDYFFEYAIEQHITLLTNYHTSKIDTSAYQGLTPSNISISEIDEARKLMRIIWTPYTQNRSQIQGLFLMSTTSLYQQLLNSQELYQSFPVEPINELKDVACHACLDFLDGITLDHHLNKI